MPKAEYPGSKVWVNKRQATCGPVQVLIAPGGALHMEIVVLRDGEAGVQFFPSPNSETRIPT